MMNTNKVKTEQVFIEIKEKTSYLNEMICFKKFIFLTDVMKTTTQN